MNTTVPEKPARPRLFVLTSEEKRTICFVCAAFVIGIAAKSYREKHAVPPRQTAVFAAAKTVRIPAEKRAEAKRRKLAR